MTVTELFTTAALKPLGPVRMGASIEELQHGVYVIARAPGPTDTCKSSPLELCEFLSERLEYDFEYEEKRWLPDEPVIYIGATNVPLHARIEQLSRHTIGNAGPHRDGQAVQLFYDPDQLWLYWSPAKGPYLCRAKMIGEFKKLAGQAPYANCAGKEWEEKRFRLGPKRPDRKGGLWRY